MTQDELNDDTDVNVNDDDDVNLSICKTSLGVFRVGVLGQHPVGKKWEIWVDGKLDRQAHKLGKIMEPARYREREREREIERDSSNPFK